jgi:hypothetical protein
MKRNALEKEDGANTSEREGREQGISLVPKALSGEE